MDSWVCPFGALCFFAMQLRRSRVSLPAIGDQWLTCSAQRGSRAAGSCVIWTMSGRRVPISTCTGQAKETGLTFITESLTFHDMNPQGLNKVKATVHSD